MRHLGQKLTIIHANCSNSNLKIRMPVPLLSTNMKLIKLMQTVLWIKKIAIQIYLIKMFKISMPKLLLLCPTLKYNMSLSDRIPQVTCGYKLLKILKT